MKTIQYMQSPLGMLTLAEENAALTAVWFGQATPEDAKLQSTPLLRKAQAELTEYFDSKRKQFTVPLAPQGTPFQQSVWKVLLSIPYGETLTYGEVAKRIGNPKASRAVGRANNRNPIPILIPCHRVIGANGKLVGYGGGLGIKETLLRLEAEREQNERY